MRHVQSMFFSTDSDGGSRSGARPERCAKGKGIACPNVAEDDSDICPAKRRRRASARSAEVLGERSAVPEVAGRLICLRCSKRLHLELQYSTPKGGAVPIGYLCDWAALRKCSYCASGHHRCEPVSLLPAYLGFC
jgi:hypothetical protein